MADVIRSPRLGSGSGRRLPLGNNPAQADVAAAQQYLDPEDAARLIAERDEALRQAEQAQAALHEIQAGLTGAREEAEARGFRDGLERAEEESRLAQAARDEEAKNLLQNLAREQRRLLQLAEETALEVGFAAVVKLLGRLRADASLVQALVRQALSQVSDREGLVVWLAPADCERMRRLAHGEQREWQGIEFKPDDQIELGGCRIDSRCGSLDARLELQMEALRSLLLQSTTPAPGEGKR